METSMNLGSFYNWILNPGTLLYVVVGGADNLSVKYFYYFKTQKCRNNFILNMSFVPEAIRFKTENVIT